MWVILLILVIFPSASRGDLEATYASANSGQELTIFCGAQENRTGEPRDCQWSKDGFGLGTEPELSGWPRYSLVGCHLKVHPVLPVDDGEYRCQATIQLENQTKPNNQTKINNQTKLLNQTKQLNQTKATNQTKPQKEEKPFSGLVVLSVNVEPGPPSIDQASLDDVMIVQRGEEVELACQSQGGKPAAQIQWNQEGGEFMMSDVWKKATRMGNLKTFKTVSKLKFKAQNNINITCSAFNEGFPHLRTSRAIEIRIPEPPQVQMEFSRSKIKEGDPFEARCVSTPEVPSLNYSWMLNESKVEGQHGNILRMVKMDEKYDGTSIKCVVENEGGTGEATKTLNIDFSPKILIHPTSQTASVGETAVFSCQAKANPPPKYIWFRVKSEEVVGVFQNLSVVASEETEGDYVCHVLAEGHPTVVSNPGRLRIKRKPKIVGKTSKFGSVGKDIILDCTVESLVRASILWTKNGEPIDELGDKYQVISSQYHSKQQSHLIIFKLKNNDFTEYGCFASNEVGTDYRVVTLDLEKEVDFLSILICSNVVLIIFISVGCFTYRHAKRRQDKEIPEFRKNNPIYKNTDTSIFDELLSGHGRREMQQQDAVEIRQNVENMNLISDKASNVKPHVM